MQRLRASKASSRVRTRLEDRATPAEKTLIVALRVAKEPYRFQEVVRTPEADGGFYVVDFYLPRRNLLVELDGAGHFSSTGQWHDRLRTEAIERVRNKDLVVRFTNSEVTNNAHKLVKYLQSF